MAVACAEARGGRQTGMPATPHRCSLPPPTHPPWPRHTCSRLPPAHSACCTARSLRRPAPARSSRCQQGSATRPSSTALVRAPLRLRGPRVKTVWCIRDTAAAAANVSTMRCTRPPPKKGERRGGGGRRVHVHRQQSAGGAHTCERCSCLKPMPLACEVRVQQERSTGRGLRGVHTRLPRGVADVTFMRPMRRPEASRALAAPRPRMAHA